MNKWGHKDPINIWVTTNFTIGTGGNNKCSNTWPRFPMCLFIFLLVPVHWFADHQARLSRRNTLLKIGTRNIWGNLVVFKIHPPILPSLRNTVFIITIIVLPIIIILRVNHQRERLEGESIIIYLNDPESDKNAINFCNNLLIYSFRATTSIPWEMSFFQKDFTWTKTLRKLIAMCLEFISSQVMMGMLKFFTQSILSKRTFFVGGFQPIKPF